MGTTFSLGGSSSSSSFVATAAGGVSVSAELSETGVTLPMHYEIVDTAPPYFGKFIRYQKINLLPSPFLYFHTLLCLCICSLFCPLLALIMTHGLGSSNPKTKSHNNDRWISEGKLRIDGNPYTYITSPFAHLALTYRSNKHY